MRERLAHFDTLFIERDFKPHPIIVEIPLLHFFPIGLSHFTFLLTGKVKRSKVSRMVFSNIGL